MIKADGLPAAPHCKMMIFASVEYPISSIRKNIISQ
jgi:hypothetical protein